MKESQHLDQALAAVERMLAEQDAELEAAFERLESLGASPVEIDERSLLDLARREPVPPPRRLAPPPMGPRC